MDYSRLTLDELLDVASHLDRDLHPDTAATVARLIEERRLRGELPSRQFFGSALVGSTAWPLATLKFDLQRMTLHVKFFGFVAREVTLERSDVTGTRTRMWWRGGGLELVHTRTDVPQPIVFKPWFARALREMLDAYRWPSPR
jgi:hypothetical protein